jgi:hypothetical protein
MSRTNPNDIDALAVQVPCAYCLAAADDWCTTSSGCWAQWLHQARTWPFYQAWGLGYDDAERAWRPRSVAS